MGSNVQILWGIESGGGRLTDFNSSHQPYAKMSSITEVIEYAMLLRRAFAMGNKSEYPWCLSIGKPCAIAVIL
jgi:hypothetical protein